MEVHDFLLEIVKVMSTVSMGILSLSIGFLDKLNINLKIKTNRQALTLLWVFLVVAIVFCSAAGLAIYLDVSYFIMQQYDKVEAPYNLRVSWQSKTSVILAGLAFVGAAIQLVSLGIAIIRQKSIDSKI